MRWVILVGFRKATLLRVAALTIVFPSAWKMFRPTVDAWCGPVLTVTSRSWQGRPNVWCDVRQFCWPGLLDAEITVAKLI